MTRSTGGSAGGPASGRVAAALRATIHDGTLAPGDRVPSTREIVARFGVAMATATKALALLRADGLVHAVPGVGTVVSGPAPGATRPSARPRPDGPPAPGGLDRAAVVTAAIAVADAEGMAAVSMRRVGAALGVATMSLYRHVADKEDLVLHMLDAAIGELDLSGPRPPGIRSRLERAARGLWAVFRRHPWIAPTMSLTRPQPIPSALVYTEWVLGALDGRGLDDTTVLTIHLTLFNYVRGTAVHLEPEREAQAETGLDADAWMDLQAGELRALVATRRFPLFERLIAGEFDLDLDALFEFGLQRLLDGLGPVVTGRIAGR